MSSSTVATRDKVARAAALVRDRIAEIDDERGQLAGALDALGFERKAPAICRVLSCGKPHRARGLCARHYEQDRQRRKLEARAAAPPTPGYQDAGAPFPRPS